MDPAVEYDLEKLPEFDRSKIAVEDGTGCWLWTSPLQRSGYGQVFREGRNRAAHRYVYEFFKGPIEHAFQQLDHLCRVRHCVNPAHLEVVEPIENVWRGSARLQVEAPPELHRELVRLLNRVYRAGVYEGLREARGKDQAS